LRVCEWLTGNGLLGFQQYLHMRVIISESFAMQQAYADDEAECNG
jgi:hypothetical protein